MTNKKYTTILAILTAMPAILTDNTVEVTNEVKPVVNDVKKVEIKTQPIKTEIKHYTMPYSTQGETLTHFAAEPLGNYHSKEKTKVTRAIISTSAEAVMAMPTDAYPASSTYQTRMLSILTSV